MDRLSAVSHVECLPPNFSIQIDGATELGLNESQTEADQKQIKSRKLIND